MDFIQQITEFVPSNEQEEQDKKVILDYINNFPHNILTRQNEIAHITSSGFIMNEDLTKVLMINHKIMNKWAWTGGHADGEENLLDVAIKEAQEETGIKKVTPLSSQIMSLDILPVLAHTKNCKYINTHLHLSVAYILIADDMEKVTINEHENSGVDWISVDKITKENFNDYDVYLYNKLIRKGVRL